uniref:Uncharacterized protein n=1 Tax=Rhizophora mucronata TaxID=61149 RepID=A0A2P2QU16_RHIMU
MNHQLTISTYSIFSLPR